jgi:5-formyltetrahydrofolate cyclo-ligase
VHDTQSAIQHAKASLRRDVTAKREALSREARRLAAVAVSARPFPLALAAGGIVSGFMPLKGEIDPLPLMRKLAADGAQLALPVIAGRGRPLIMREWRFGDSLISGVWGIREPGPEAAEVAPDIILAPLLAFDRAGHRLGYGGGYYDRTIARLRATKPVVVIGLAFALQEVPAVPVTPDDVPLDLVLTEREAIDFRGG